MENLTKQQALEKIEDPKKYVEEEGIKKTKKVCIEIKSRFTGEIKFISEKETIREACQDNKANLYGANLYGANLYGANLSGANLSGADLREANLSGANLYKANLYKANLSEANLYKADLYKADLREANLSEAEMQNAKFYGRGGSTKIKKSQVDDFFKALGVVVEE